MRDHQSQCDSASEDHEGLAILQLRVRPNGHVHFVLFSRAASELKVWVPGGDFCSFNVSGPKLGHQPGFIMEDPWVTESDPDIWVTEEL